MRIPYKLTAVFIILSLLLSTVASAQTTKIAAPSVFKDLPDNHPFVSAVADLKAQGLVKGYGDGTFGPDRSISRAEFVTMIMASIGGATEKGGCFTDVPEGEWFSTFVCSAKAQGLVTGYTGPANADNEIVYFKPHNNINFAEVAAIMAKAHKLFPRAPSSSEPWYKPAVQRLEAKSAIPVTIDYMERLPSRAEVAEMIWRLKTENEDKTTKTYAELTAPVPQIASCAELTEKFAALSYKQNRGYGGPIEKMSLQSLNPGDDDDDSTAESNAPAAAPAPGADGDDYSSTNVQVAGVDEADVIKNDDQFFYIISGSKVRIVKAYPPDDLSEVGVFEMSGKDFRPSDLYVTGNKLVVIGNTSGAVQPLSDAAIQSKIMIWKSNVQVYVLDISDKKNIKELRSVTFEGNEISTRRIGSRLYLILNDYPDYYHILENKAEASDVLPHYTDSLNKDKRMPLVNCDEIGFMPRYDDMNFLTVASINLDNSTEPVKKEVIMGAGNTVYASTQNIYVATQQYDFPAVGVRDIWGSPLNIQAPMPESTEKTVLFSFGINNGDVKFKTKGEVPGHLLNQFSMDEEGSAFRVAVTTGQVWNTQQKSQNHLYILDKENLATTLGKVENMAPGETIYSVRFLGNRAYMVTFKKIDPFFVIDVGDPRSPKVLGELKIPGYSNYLHPFDENHVIGFGKDAVDPQEVENAGITGRGFDFAWYQGMKIALFDVTDVANPKVLFNEMIGDRGTDSEVLYNHKALLYDKARNLFAFPVTVAEVKDKTGDKYTGSQYGETVFQGAYVYTLDLRSGFQLKGKITHYDDPGNFAQPDYYWYSDKNTIKRIGYIKDYLYTISTGKIKAIKRDDMSEAKSLTLPVPELVPIPYIE